MTLDECQRKVTHREFVQWCRWLIEDQNKPSRSDHYVMQLTMELRLIRYGLSGIKKSVSLDELKLPFGAASKPSQPSVTATKMKWFGVLGIDDERITGDSEPDRQTER